MRRKGRGNPPLGMGEEGERVGNMGIQRGEGVKEVIKGLAVVMEWVRDNAGGR